jgi:hypothetical protein
MPPRLEVLREGTIRREEALGVTRGFEPLQAPLSLAGGLMGMFRTVVEVAVLAMFDAGQEFPLGRSLTLEFSRHDHARHVPAPFEELAETLLRGLLVSTALDKHIQDRAVLIHRPPEVVALALDGEKDLIERSRVTGLRTPMAELIGILLAKFATPFPNRFIRHHDTAGNQQLFDIPVAEAKAVVQPDTMADDLGRETMVMALST